MSFSFIPLAALTVIFLAACLACLFALLLQKIFKRNFGRFRLVFACLFASAAVVCLTLLLVFVPLQSAFTKVDLMYYGILFFLAFVAVLFFRFVGTIFILLYMTYVVTFSFSLYKWFGSPVQNAELLVTETEFLYQGSPLPYKKENSAGSASAAGDAKTHYVVFSGLKLPSLLLLPLPKMWYRPEYVASLADTQLVERYGTGSKANKLLAAIIEAAECVESQTGAARSGLVSEKSSAPDAEASSVFFTVQTQIPSQMFLPASFKVEIERITTNFAVKIYKQ